MPLNYEGAQITAMAFPNNYARLEVDALRFHTTHFQGIAYLTPNFLGRVSDVLRRAGHDPASYVQAGVLASLENDLKPLEKYATHLTEQYRYGRLHDSEGRVIGYEWYDHADFMEKMKRVQAVPELAWKDPRLQNFKKVREVPIHRNERGICVNGRTLEEACRNMLILYAHRKFIQKP
jgi:hypothetical protein